MDKPEDTVTVMAVGDIMLGRAVGQEISNHLPGWVFSNIKPLLEHADVFVGNLESPMANSADGFSSDAKIPLRGEQKHVIELKLAKCAVMNLANNHILDYGEQGLLDTLTALEGHGIHHVGAGSNLAQASRPLRLVVNGSRLSFVSFCSSYNASTSTPGTAPYNQGFIKQQVQQEKMHSDFIFVSLHHGVEYADYPGPGLIDLAHQIIDCGAAVVLGHHPHVLQGIETYRNGVIAYSLGNFVFDLTEPVVIQKAYEQSILTRKYGVQFDSMDKRPIESVILEIIIEKNAPVRYTIHPVLIQDDYRPALLDGGASNVLLERIYELSRNIGNHELLINQILRKAEMNSLQDYLNDKGMKYYIGALHKLRWFHLKMLLPILKAKFAPAGGIKEGE